uniref:VWFA domain-containing protein n=1 Tax=Oryzias latipes TaxID=8090 RepID=A0A3P9KJE2_ORYLA
PEKFQNFCLWFRPALDFAASSAVLLACQQCENALVGDIVFLVDSSSSIGPENFELVKTFLGNVIKPFDIGPKKIQFGLAQYSKTTQKEFLLKDHADQESVLTAVQQLYYLKKSTRTGGALDFIRKDYFVEAAGSRVGELVPQIAVLITDGESNDPVETPAQQLRDHGVLVFCVGVGKDAQKQLKTIANPPQDHYVFIVDRYEDLHSLLDSLKEGGGVCVEDEFSLHLFFLSVLTKRYTDMFWLVDNSLPPEQFSQLKSNLSGIITGNEVGRSSHRLGLAQFGQDVQVEFLLNTYENKGQILEAVGNFKLQPQAKQQRNLSRALELATTRFFKAEAGGRAHLGVHQDLVIVMENEQYSLSMLREPNLESVIECVGAGVADVVFVLKGSEGTGEDNFPFVLTFLSLIINSLEISQAKVRVGIVTSGPWLRVEAHLNTFTGKAELLHFIGLLPPREGGAKIGVALKLTWEMLFSEERGGRKNAQKVAVVIADSKSQDSVREAASFLRRDGATIYAVGVKDADPTELEEMASHPSSRHVFPRANFSSLRAETHSLLKGLCNGIANKQRTAGGTCAETHGADIFFLLDVSGRISQLDLRDMQNFIIGFLRFLRIGPDHVRMGVVTYSHSPSLQSDLMEDADQIKEAVLALQREGGAAYVGKALSFLNQGTGETAERQVPRYLVVISGGEATDDFKGPAEALRRKDITLLAIGAKKSNETQLTEISGDSRRTFYVNHFDALKSISDGVLAEICAPEACKAYPADVFFLMSSSAALSKRDFEKMKDLLKSVISLFSIGPNAVHVGVMQVGANHSLEFGLNKYLSREEVLRAVDRMQPVKDGYRMGRSLSEVSKYFKAGGGGRPGLKQSLVVVTDLQSTDEVRGPAEALRNKDVEVYAVGVLEASKKQLLEISNSSDKVFQLEDLDQLPAVGRRLALKLCGKGTSFRTGWRSTAHLLVFQNNVSSADCEKKDLVFLLDYSTSISPDNHNMVINFTADLVSSLTFGENFLQVGLAQFSDALHHEFYLSEYSSKADVVRHILSSKHAGGTTYLGKALRSVEDYFLPSRGARGGTSKTLVMITDGNSLDDVEDAAEGLRNMGIEILAVGVGDVYDLQLLRIVGNPKNLFSIWNFNFLANNKKKVVNAICRKPSSCRIDVFIGFDASRSGTRSGKALKTFLPGLEEIVRHISTVEDLWCSAAVHTNISFHKVDADGFLRYNASFKEDWLREVLNKWSQPTYFNSTLLNFFRKNFREKSEADVKVLLIFSDGLDEEVMKLEQTSDLLQKSGVSVLLTVALAGADPAQLQMVEFGRGFGYDDPLSIGQKATPVTSAVHPQSDAAHRLCCGVMCKCSGPAGDRGPSGIPGMKVPGKIWSLAVLRVFWEKKLFNLSAGCFPARVLLDGGGDPGHDGITGEPGHPGSPAPCLASPPCHPQGAPGINGKHGIEGQRGLRGDLNCENARLRKGFIGRSYEDSSDSFLPLQGRPGPAGQPGQAGWHGPNGQKACIITHL